MKTNKTSISTNFMIILLCAAVLRIILAAFSNGFETDINCFGAWALRIYTGGFSAFYSPDVFTDYPPGYMYVLYVIGWILHTFKIYHLSPLGLVLLKLPSILTDILAGFIAYYLSKDYFSEKSAIILSSLYLFNPAVLINSVVWGQVDSILVLFILMLCLCLYRGYTVSACFVFVLGTLFKPQTLVFTPVLLFGIYEFEILRFKNLRNFFIRALGGLCSLFMGLLLAFPFGLVHVIRQFTDTLGSYPYVSVNAYNFWSLLGLNWASQNNIFWGLSYKTWGTVILVILTLISAVLFEILRRHDHPCRYFLTAAFLMVTTFTFSVRMHERYLYPAMALLLFTFIFSRSYRILISYLMISAAHFINVWHVLNYYDPQNYHMIAGTIRLLSGITLLCAAFFFHALLHTCKSSPTAQKPLVLPQISIAQKPSASKPSARLTFIDWTLMLGITIVYAIVAFTNLGYAKAPVTEYDFESGSTIFLEFDDTSIPAVLDYYLGYEDKLSLSIAYSLDGITWSKPQSIDVKNMYSWGQIGLTQRTPYLSITNIGESGTLGELVFLDADHNLVAPQNAIQYNSLFDESDTVPATMDFRSQAYFDEIYYNRVIHEFSEGLPAYENTHPPLGKIFMWIGTLIFGMNPLGFRFMGTLFGVCMLPLLYLLAKDLVGNSIISALTTLSFAFDFMHFTQTRIATIDVYIVFFIIAMYLFMERYLRLSFYDTPFTKTLIPLGACGIMFGLGISSKWTGFYAGAGLALLFFASLFKRYREYRYACLYPDRSTDGIRHSQIIQNFSQYTIKTIAFCVLFFITIPLCIYVLSYIPFRDYHGTTSLLERMWINQGTMYNYHSTLTATHPYSSPWYQWHIMVRPVFYYSNKLGNDIYQGISAFGNPLVWYLSTPALFYTLYMAIVKHKSAAGFLATGYLSLLLPWVLVSRCTFLYHYFPCVPFLVLMLGYTAAKLKKKTSAKQFYSLCALYAVGIIILFIMFYPVISGMPVSGTFTDTFLRWRDSWVLIIK